MFVIQSEPLQDPGCCFICETNRPGVRHIDTSLNSIFRHPDGGEVWTHLSGRKYVCEVCVDEMARLLGYVHEDDVRSRIAVAREAQNRYETLRSRMRDVLEEA